MRDNPGARCALQIARDRRLGNHPDTFGPEQDICDVTMWLREKYPVSELQIWISRHYTQRDREMAGISVTSERTCLGSLALKVHEAFLALGYRIQDMSKDTYRCPTCYGHHSRHEVLLAFARVERALRIWRQT